MKARAALRAATAEQHKRVDRIFSEFDLASREDYRRFLLAQAEAFLPVEQALDEGGIADLVDDWRERRRGALLRADLGALGQPPPQPPATEKYADAPSLLAALYVLEGSRMGGALLIRHLAADLPQTFLNARHSSVRWRKLLDRLEESLYRNDLIESAVDSARAVFERFEAAGLRYREAGKA